LLTLLPITFSNVITPGAFLVGIVLLCYLAIDAAGGLVVGALFFGFFSGIFIALPPVLFVALTKDKSQVGTRSGMGFTMVAAGVLCGGPGGGAILGQNEHDLHWTSLWIYAGITTIAAGVVFFILRFVKVGWKFNVKI
jgi:MFS family permease